MWLIHGLKSGASEIFNPALPHKWWDYSLVSEGLFTLIWMIFKFFKSARVLIRVWTSRMNPRKSQVNRRVLASRKLYVRMYVCINTSAILFSVKCYKIFRVLKSSRVHTSLRDSTRVPLFAFWSTQVYQSRWNYLSFTRIFKLLKIITILYKL